MSMSTPIIIDIGPTERRAFAGPRDIFNTLAGNNDVQCIGTIKNMNLFTHNYLDDRHIHGLTLKVAGSPIILPPSLAFLSEPIRKMAQDHAENPDYDYKGCRAVLAFSQKGIEAGKTNMNSTDIHLDTTCYADLLRGTYDRRNSYIVSDLADYTTRFYTHPIIIDRDEIMNTASPQQAFDRAIIAKCYGAKPYIPKAGEIIRFTESTPHKANPVRTEDDGIRRTLLIVDFYQDKCGSINKNPNLRNHLSL